MRKLVMAPQAAPTAVPVTAEPRTSSTQATMLRKSTMVATMPPAWWRKIRRTTTSPLLAQEAPHLGRVAVLVVHQQRRLHAEGAGRPAPPRLDQHARRRIARARV